MTKETAAQYIKNQLKFSTENEKIEEHKRKTMHGQFQRELERPPTDKEKSLAWLRHKGRNGEFDNSSRRSGTENALSLEKHHEATK